MAQTMPLAWGKAAAIAANYRKWAAEMNTAFNFQSLSKDAMYSIDFRIRFMREALKTTKSKHLVAYAQMSYQRKLSFIARVERHGRKQYPNQQHMRDVYAHYVAARVAHELKD